MFLWNFQYLIPNPRVCEWPCLTLKLFNFHFMNEFSIMRFPFSDFFVRWGLDLEHCFLVLPFSLKSFHSPRTHTYHTNHVLNVVLYNVFFLMFLFWFWSCQEKIELFSTSPVLTFPWKTGMCLFSVYLTMSLNCAEQGQPVRSESAEAEVRQTTSYRRIP